MSIYLYIHKYLRLYNHIIQYHTITILYNIFNELLTNYLQIKTVITIEMHMILQEHKLI